MRGTRGSSEWTYVRGTALARECGVDGYYVRVAPGDVGDEQPASGGRIPIKNRPVGARLRRATRTS